MENERRGENKGVKGCEEILFCFVGWSWFFIGFTLFLGYTFLCFYLFMIIFCRRIMIISILSCFHFLTIKHSVPHYYHIRETLIQDFVFVEF
jgi:hypothetical protein